MTFDKRKQAHLEDRLLWSGLRNGDSTAFNTLIKKYTDLLFNYGTRFTTDRDIVKDCVQELFVEIWKKREVITEPDSVKWYLSVALRNRIFREQTKWNKTQMLAEDEDYDFYLEYSVEKKIIEHTADVELAKKIKRVLETLPPRQKEIVYLRYYENFDHDQIAELMKINKQSVHNLLQKAYKNIKLGWSIVIVMLGSLLYHFQS